MPLNAKTKGATGEREAAFLLQKWASEVGFTIDPERNLEQTRGGGFDLNGVPGLAVEVKRVEKANVDAWWRQCTRQAAAESLIPFLMWRQNRRKWAFRVRTVVAHYGPTVANTQYLDIDLSYDQGELFFKMYLQTVLTDAT